MPGYTGRPTPTTPPQRGRIGPLGPGFAPGDSYRKRLEGAGLTAGDIATLPSGMAAWSASYGRAYFEANLGRWMPNGVPANYTLTCDNYGPISWGSSLLACGGFYEDVSPADIEARRWQMTDDLHVNFVEDQGVNPAHPPNHLVFHTGGATRVFSVSPQPFQSVDVGAPRVWPLSPDSLLPFEVQPYPAPTPPGLRNPSASPDANEHSGPPKLEPPKPVFKPPYLRNRSGKEQKLSTSPKVAGAVLEALTEGADFVGALWRGLPPEYRTKGAGTPQQIGDIYNNFQHINWPFAILNIMVETAVDSVVGRVTGPMNQVFRRNGLNAVGWYQYVAHSGPASDFRPPSWK